MNLVLDCHASTAIRLGTAVALAAPARQEARCSNCIRRTGKSFSNCLGCFCSSLLGIGWQRTRIQRDAPTRRSGAGCPSQRPQWRSRPGSL